MIMQVNDQLKAHTESSELQYVLLSNGTFSGMCGFFIIMMSSATGDLLGTHDYLPNWAFVIGGGNLALYGCILYVIASLKPIPRVWVMISLVLDICWVLGSIAIATLYHTSLSQTAPVLIVAIAFVVAGFAYLQWKYLSQSA